MRIDINRSWDQLHLLENTLDRKRISANFNPKPNPYPLTLALKHNDVLKLTKLRHFSIKCKYTDVNTVCSFNHLVVKLLQPGNCEMTLAVYESSCHLLLPV